MEVLQTSALPLGYATGLTSRETIITEDFPTLQTDLEFSQLVGCG